MTTIRSRSLITILFWLIPQIVLAVEHYFVAPGTQFHQVYSEKTKRNYELLVTLPSSYSHSPDRRYPVVFLTDAQWDMALVTNVLGKLNYDNHLHEMIIVGISYPGKDAKYDQLRLKDMTPVPPLSGSQKTSPADVFLDIIESQFIPLIEKKYRIDPEVRAFGGVSLGGAFALYAALKKPGLFKRYIAISPAVIMGDNYLLEYEASYFKRHKSLPIRLFVTYGEDEYPLFIDPIKKIQNIIQTRNYKGLALRNHSVEEGRHGSVAIEGWMHGLLWVFADKRTGKADPLKAILE
ncbi:MAG: hypothetical protein KTR16_13970 [Acidiferrobacterales bacterium]|nr:hypothetical protein [Acidiferrobacterales bacterium]